MESYKNKESFITNKKGEKAMMYFVQDLKTYAPKNRACKILLDFIEKYKDVLIKDGVSFNALGEEICTKIKEINAEHPKLKEIRCSNGKLGNGAYRIDASVKSMGCSDQVFILDMRKVRGIYQLSEPVAIPKKVIPIPGICRVCGCTENDPCFHLDHGACWWVDDEHTMCSHCEDPQIKDDPHTEHCINTKHHLP